MSEAIRVLIVDDILETRENLRKLLQFERGIEVVGEAETGAEALRRAAALKPDVVIMDINLPDANGLDVTEELRRRDPAMQVVILSVQEGREYMRRAMKAGAYDYLVKPPPIDELLAAVRGAGQTAQEERARQRDTGVFGSASSAGGSRLGRLIAVYSPRGGTGCTFLATNLAVALKSPDTTVIVADAKLQFGDVALVMNVQPRYTFADLAEVESLDADLVSEVLLPYPKGDIHVLAAPLRPEEAEQIAPQTVSATLQHLKALADYVVVDTASALDAVTLSVFDVADLIVVPIGQDLPSIRNARVAIETLMGADIPKEKWVLVLNRAVKRSSITPERIRNYFKIPSVLVVPEDPRVVLSLNKGELLLLSQRNSPASKGILQVARTVRERLLQVQEH
ncbi:MAG: response regulator/pilus assembly protein [Chloroflexi bacterium]|nr:response regulator/pilus assembly protein [Chloroflexota bacterium]